MKGKLARFVLVLGIILILATSVAMAMETNVYTAKVTSGRPLVVFVETNRPGDITATVEYDKKVSGNNWTWLQIWDGGDYGCIQNTGMSPIPGYLTCTLPDAPAGTYRVDVSVMSGNAQVTLSV